ncbi:hypothetical protein [Flagellimonas sp.]|uniref:hypothetical protein n=1 Tax=Flagellimonas sp. TaxID=2058762 RepID=UPI003AB77917
MLLVTAQYVHTTTQECVLSDRTFSDVALGANVNAFVDRRIPVGKDGQKPYENVV